MKTAIHHLQHVVPVFNCLCTTTTYAPNLHKSTVHTTEGVLPNYRLEEKTNEQQNRSFVQLPIGLVRDCPYYVFQESPYSGQRSWGCGGPPQRCSGARAGATKAETRANKTRNLTVAILTDIW